MVYICTFPNVLHSILFHTAFQEVQAESGKEALVAVHLAIYL